MNAQAMGGIPVANLFRPRDKPLTLSWELKCPGILDYLPRLSRNAMVARARIVAELLALLPDQWISYSRRWHFYSGPSRRYHPECRSYRAIIAAIDQLDVEGLIDHQRMPPFHLGEQSRIRPSGRLLDAYRGAKVLHIPRELIVLRDAYGEPLDYRDNREIRRMRKGVISINEMLAGADIRIAGERMRNERMSRIFNRNFQRGGRFYGGRWQNIPEKPQDDQPGRSQISINGDETVEVDYPALHPRMLYREAGKPLVGDPYDFAERSEAKLALLIAINADSDTEAVSALAHKLGDQSNAPEGVPWHPNHIDLDRARGLLGAAKVRHPDIAPYFGSDAGARLMRRDSDIAEQIMLSLERRGIPSLSVHDSFIVQRKTRQC